MIAYFYDFEEITIAPLDAGGLDIWVLSIPKLFSYHEYLQGLLSNDEMKRALSFRRREDQVRAIFSRGLLRYFIGHYLRRDNRLLHFHYEQYGKPFLKDETLQFNLSHSKNLIAFAFTSLGCVGIDIEYKQALTDDLISLLATVSSELELACFRQIPESQKLDVFYHLWTLKEAYGKALGKGLHSGLRDVDVATSVVALVSSWESSKIITMKNYFALGGFPLPEFAGAVACEEVPKDLRVRLLL